MTLDYTTLENAIARLKEGLKAYEKFKEDEELKEIVRDSLVQRFEFTYEHSIKQLAKTLREQGYEPAKADPDNKKVLFRTARDTGYILDFQKWNSFNKTRNITSHEYDEEFVASEKYIDFVRDFYDEVRILLKNMKEIEL